MKKFLFALLVTLTFNLFPQTAKIKIDIERIIGEIDPKIYGVFMEPIHFSGRRMGLPDTVDFNTLYEICTIHPHLLRTRTDLEKIILKQ